MRSESRVRRTTVVVAAALLLFTAWTTVGARSVGRTVSLHDPTRTGATHRITGTSPSRGRRHRCSHRSRRDRRPARRASKRADLAPAGARRRNPGALRAPETAGWHWCHGVSPVPPRRFLSPARLHSNHSRERRRVSGDARAADTACRGPIRAPPDAALAGPRPRCQRGQPMHGHDDALSVGVTAADIAWPLILAICFALDGPAIRLLVHCPVRHRFRERFR